MLAQALGTKEHPGRTRGTGVVPWKLAFPQESNTYQSCSRGSAEQEAEYLRRLKEMEDRMEARIEVTFKARVEQILLSKGSGVPQNPTPTAFSPQFRGRSSCGSTPLDEEEANVPHSVDDITEPVNVRLYIHQEWTKDKVALGQAKPGLWEMGQLMATQFHWGTLASPLTEYLIRSITRYPLSTP